MNCYVMDKQQNPRLYGISKKIIKQIILECLDEQLLFSKFLEFINDGGVDSKLSELIEEKIKEYLIDVNEDVEEMKTYIKTLEERINTLENKEYSNVKGVVANTENKSTEKKFDAMFGGMGIKIV